MISVNCVRNASDGLRAKSIQNNSVQRPIALGINVVAPDNKGAWMILRFSEDTVAECELRITDPLEDPHAELGVELTVMASSEVWLEIGAGGLPAAVQAADARKLVVGGKLPYFIRNVRSLLEIMVGYAAELTLSAEPQ